MGLPQAIASNNGEVTKKSLFFALNVDNSKMVGDTSKVTIND